MRDLGVKQEEDLKELRNELVRVIKTKEELLAEKEVSNANEENNRRKVFVLLVYNINKEYIQGKGICFACL